MPSRDFALNRAKVQMSSPFLRDPEILHVFNVPLPSLSRLCVCVCVFFFAGNVGLLKTQNIPKNTKPPISSEKKKKTFVKGTAGAR